MKTSLLPIERTVSFPERAFLLVWASDWPYPTEKANSKSDDAVLFDLLADWAPDEAIRNRPGRHSAALYGFE